MIHIYLNKQRRKRLEQGHPWVFANEVGRVELTDGDEAATDEAATDGGMTVTAGAAAPSANHAGALAHIFTHQGRFLATGIYNPKSQIIARVVAEQPLQVLDKLFFVERIRKAWSLRRRFVADTGSCRAVYGEADLLPGLVVDKYEQYLVVQMLSLAMDVRRDLIVEALVELFSPTGIYERSEASVRQLEGLPERTGLLYGEVPRHVEIRENGLLVLVDLYEGQKTGYFFDQRENRAAIAPLMLGWGERSGIALRPEDEAATIGELPTHDLPTATNARLVPYNSNGKRVTFPYWDGATVLECFAHTGSFTLHACMYGAKQVTCLDISEHAIATARENVARNGFAERVEFVVADAFVYLRERVAALEERKQRAGRAKVDTSVPMTSKARKWDVVILDPPAFAKNRAAVENAAKGYKEIHIQALKLISEGGFLVSASCSFHIRPSHFLEIIQAAAYDAGKRLRLTHFSGAGRDHPHILGVEEGNYLKFAIFEVTSRL